MPHRSFAWAAAVLCFSLVPVSLVKAQSRAVLELFTSQGCSSCPAADRLLSEFVADPSVVSMSVPIDYWDYLGWKDTLADPRNTLRQKAYAQARGDGQVYTPQVVVNGSLHALGSDQAAIEHAINKSRKIGAMSLAGVMLKIADGRLDVAIPADSVGRRVAEVWLYGMTRYATVAIGRGENKGRTITYNNVIRRWLKLGEWSGKAESWSIPLRSIAGDGIDRAAILVQSGTTEKPGTILGAATASLH
jgi:hypothetical protein